MRQRGHGSARSGSGLAPVDDGSGAARRTRLGQTTLVIAFALVYCAVVLAAWPMIVIDREVGSVLDALVIDPDPTARGAGGRIDSDGDGVDDATDNCLFTPNPTQDDNNLDGVGNACDNKPESSNMNQFESEASDLGTEQVIAPLSIRVGG